MSSAASLLSSARRAAGLTQRELARRAGTPQPSISRIERGTVSPTVDTLRRLLVECGQDLEGRASLGEGLDRSLIRERLEMTPSERIRRTSLEWRRTAAFRGDRGERR